jgi:site-specific DNA-methyltransferase (adenine-specific)
VTDPDRSAALEPFVSDPDFTLYHGDCCDVLRSLDEASAYACVTSPPYMDARGDYASFDRYPELFYALSRVVTDAVLVNVGRVWRSGIEQMWWLDIISGARSEGWHLVDTLVWVKPNANPIHGAVFADSHEYVLIFVRGAAMLNEDGIRRPHAPATVARFGRAWVNHRATKDDRESRARKMRAEPNPLGARARSYFEATVGKEKGNPHPAPMPAALADHLVTLATFPGQTVLDPFFGSGTTGLAARKLGRVTIGIESRENYCAMAAQRLGQQSLIAEGAA